MRVRESPVHWCSFVKLIIRVKSNGYLCVLGFYYEYNKYIFPIEKGHKNAVHVNSSSASEWKLRPPLTRQVDL